MKIYDLQTIPDKTFIDLLESNLMQNILFVVILAKHFQSDVFCIY